MAAEGAPPPTETASPATPAAPAQEPERAEDWETRFKYLLADFENFRKRVARDWEGQRQQVHAGLLGRLLPLFEAARAARDAVGRLPASDPVRRGVDLLALEWEKLLTAEGVEPVARVGSPFEADRHEAVAEAPPSRTSPAGTVVEIVQQGYRIGATLLRPAKVVVARATPPAPAPRAEDAAAPDAEDGPG